MKFFDRFRKEQTPTRATEAPMNLTSALASFKNGGVKPPEEKGPTDEEWLDIWRRLQPYVKNLAPECASEYTTYVQNTGNTTCETREIRLCMTTILWEAYRRARIKELYPHVKTLPNLAPYFIDTVRLLNSQEGNIDNHVAYICERNKGTNETTWFIAPIQAARRKPKVPTDSKSEITKTLY